MDYSNLTDAQNKFIKYYLSSIQGVTDELNSYKQKAIHLEASNERLLEENKQLQSSLQKNDDQISYLKCELTNKEKELEEYRRKIERDSQIKLKLNNFFDEMFSPELKRILQTETPSEVKEHDTSPSIKINVSSSNQDGALSSSTAKTISVDSTKHFSTAQNKETIEMFNPNEDGHKNPLSNISISTDQDNLVREENKNDFNSGENEQKLDDKMATLQNEKHRIPNAFSLITKRLSLDYTNNQGLESHAKNCKLK